MTVIPKGISLQTPTNSKTAVFDFSSPSEILQSVY